MDFPTKPAMLASDILVLTRAGDVTPARLGIQPMARALHTAARRLRVYTAKPVRLRPEAVAALAARDASSVSELLADDRALLER